MHCLGCGEDIDVLEEQCREESYKQFRETWHCNNKKGIL
ncbi:MAG: hypothetical protein G01um101470_355 [Parcubacteria group bacterium Gr01-1014_70]|nr:MAG: hypothetical protein G01um101470_355 [Parcubacteria group bacterium Gr01-1014_70]